MSTWLVKKAQFLLDNPQQAMVWAAIFSVAPYMSWLSAVILALVFLRKGIVPGSQVLCAAVLALFMVLKLYWNDNNALLNATMVFMPVYLGAGLLRLTSSWRLTLLFGLVVLLLLSFILQASYGDWILEQYFTFKKMMLYVMQDNPEAIALFKSSTHEVLFANYLLGVKFLSVFLSALSSLLLARWVQASLFYPSGLQSELMAFRAHAPEGLLYAIILLGVYFDYAVAANILLVASVYFLMAGLSLGRILLGTSRARWANLFLFAPLVVFPYVMCPFYIILGLFDSWINIRTISFFKTNNTK